jgi:hypothetical protein
MLEKLIVFVEEYSMEAALYHLLPNMLGGTDFEVRRFQCKDDLLQKLPMELKAMGTWLPDDWTLLVLVDRDDDDCQSLKANLEAAAKTARLKTKTTTAAGKRFQVVNRIVIEELESWFFGDWAAVQAAYPRVPATIPRKAGFRDPDAIAGGTWEALERVLKKAGYHQTGLRKAELARAVAPNMNPEVNTSRSFQAFRDALKILLS